jgi:hypothetical protein
VQKPFKESVFLSFEFFNKVPMRQKSSVGGRFQFWLCSLGLHQDFAQML